MSDPPWTDDDTPRRGSRGRTQRNRRGAACRICGERPDVAGPISWGGLCALCAAVALCEAQLGATVIAMTPDRRAHQAKIKAGIVRARQFKIPGKE